MIGQQPKRFDLYYHIKHKSHDSFLDQYKWDKRQIELSGK